MAPSERSDVTDVLEQSILKIKKNDDDDFKIPRPTRASRSKWNKLASLPNVHTNLYLVEMARKYATVINASVLSKKVKHKSFKKMADNAAFPNLMGYLFAKNVLRQSMRLGLAGA